MSRRRVFTAAVPAEGDTPAFVLRHDPRARRVRLRVTVRDGLVVTIPRSLSRDAIRDVLREHAEWIERSLADVAERRGLLERGAEALVPDEVAFNATGEVWRVVRDPGTCRDRTGVRVSETSDALLLRGEVDDSGACLEALRRWLTRSARTRLKRMLADVAEEQGLSYARVSVRAQHGRWGSCSAAGTISLNRALVFTEPRVARSVLLHELVHTLVSDHSERFWSELERRDRACRADRRAMREAWDQVPLWALP